MSVIGEGFHHLAAGVNEVFVQPRHRVPDAQSRPPGQTDRLKVAAPFELEEVALGANDGPDTEALKKALLGDGACVICGCAVKEFSQEVAQFATGLWAAGLFITDKKSSRSRAGPKDRG